MKKNNLILFCLTLTVSFIITLSSFRNSSSSSISTGTEPLFEEEHPSTIVCGGVFWTKTTYFSSAGSIVGTTYVKGGVVEASYTGSYSSSTYEQGEIPGRTGFMTDCYGWGWGCHKVTAAEACQ